MHQKVSGVVREFMGHMVEFEREKRGKKQTEAEELARRTREKLVVSVLKQIIMQGGTDLIREDVKTRLLETYTRMEREFKVKSKAIHYLLLLYGENIP